MTSRIKYWESFLFFIFLLFTGLYSCQTMTSGKQPDGTYKYKEAEEGLIKTGLNPIYPSDAACPEVASFFGDRTRYDGSMRVSYRNSGYHGGIDISLPEGTPILAIADGTIVYKARGGRLVGLKMTIQHAPEDTGLPVWTFSSYKHFSAWPELEVGDRVKMGQEIALSGKSGTVGGHYGVQGYPHLHMSVQMSDSNKFKSAAVGAKIKIKGATHIDPLAMYYRRLLDSQVIEALPPEEKAFQVPYVDTDGYITPIGTRTVWPVSCKKNTAEQ